MDIPQVLAVLRPGEDWGPCAQSDSTYSQLADTWRGVTPVPTEAEMEAEWADIEAARPTEERDTRRAAAVSLSTAPDRSSQLLRAALLVTMDELNLLREWITLFKGAVANASNLAALKTAVASLPNVPQREANDIKPALIVRIGTTDADM